MNSHSNNAAKDQDHKIDTEFIMKFPAPSAPDYHYELKTNLQIPFKDSAPELAYRLISTLRPPFYIYDVLIENIQNFVKEKLKIEQDRLADELVSNTIKQKNSDIDALVKQWEISYKTEVTQYCSPTAMSDEELFAEAYHQLVHSPMLDKVLKGIEAMSAQVSQMVTLRDAEINQLSYKQEREMHQAIESLSEDQINSLANSHLEHKEMLHVQWESRLDSLKTTQRREARAWLVGLSQQAQPDQNLSLWPEIEEVARKAPTPSNQSAPTMQESFTIHLGSQMKQMHNVRLLASDILALCDCPGQTQRIHTSLSLYSNELQGLVFFTDCHSPATSASFAAFRDVCQNGTELHFLPVEHQLESLTSQARQAVEWRLQNNDNKSGAIRRNLQPGDCYITKHSSLAEAHVVYHILSDDSVMSDVTSRNPIILGLRNILKTSSAYDITCLTIPLLLVHEMSEEMTVVWCTKRAELVFKCIKGFMIETASWGGSELKTIQFVLPEGISENLFKNLCLMLSSIFRVSNPLKFTGK
ncbi:protein C12orf4 [Neocloeon triangulifer]|uniref:protein C12orf4 n=1 Tax=Neocloeon triangulifer TaxID=2078957 RepID=UPI00286F1FBE|nr:protein C12orf4 [Neocloeon triangulifer]XP_059474752.1 protein C12orf4 [Neocloeon triangulifer]